MTPDRQDHIDSIVFELEELVAELRKDWAAVEDKLDDDGNSYWNHKIKDIESAARTLRELE